MPVPDGPEMTTGRRLVGVGPEVVEVDGEEVVVEAILAPAALMHLERVNEEEGAEAVVTMGGWEGVHENGLAVVDDRERRRREFMQEGA